MVSARRRRGCWAAEHFPECVLLSSESYTSLMDELNDARLLAVANARLQKASLDDAIPADDVYRELGISEEDLAGADDVGIE